MKIPSFCVVLPMYNERPNAAPCIQKLTAFLQKIPTRTAIIAVDDGSVDGTLAELRGLESAIPNLIIEARSQNGGYGAANRTGFAAALREGFDPAGAPIRRDATGFHARVVQHECDHLLGILYPMRMRDFRQFGFTDILFPDAAPEAE